MILCQDDVEIIGRTLHGVHKAIVTQKIAIPRMFHFFLVLATVFELMTFQFVPKKLSHRLRAAFISSLVKNWEVLQIISCLSAQFEH